jgi:hypothetical protein
VRGLESVRISWIFKVNAVSVIFHQLALLSERKGAPFKQECPARETWLLGAVAIWVLGGMIDLGIARIALAILTKLNFTGLRKKSGEAL